MRLERPVILAIIALVAVAAAASGYYGYEMWKEKQPLQVGKGAFAELYYIGYLENGSIFDSSFVDANITIDTPFNASNYTLSSFRLYVEDDSPSEYPDGWNAGNYNVIEGLWKGIIGMKESDEKTLTIPPEKAYGMPVETGITFLSDFTDIEQKFFITAVNLTDVTLDLKWIPELGEKFTMPMYWSGGYLSNPYWVLENATEVISFNETNATIKTTPNKLDSLTLYPFWEGYTTASFNDTTISLITTPEIGSDFSYYGYTYIVENVTDDKINISITYENETYYQEVNKTLTFDRTFNITRMFDKIPGDYLQEDLNNGGYSFNELAGKTLYYKIKLNHIYKV